MGSSLKFTLGFLLGVLLLVTVSPETSAQANPFDASYTNCPAHLRLGPLSGIVARHPVVEGDLRTDQIEVKWDAPDPATWQVLGDRRYSAQVTVIVDGPDELMIRHASLGSESVTFENTALASRWKVWVAVTDQQHVINDIAFLGSR